MQFSQSQMQNNIGMLLCTITFLQTVSNSRHLCNIPYILYYIIHHHHHHHHHHHDRVASTADASLQHHDHVVCIRHASRVLLLRCSSFAELDRSNERVLDQNVISNPIANRRTTDDRSTCVRAGTSFSDRAVGLRVCLSARAMKPKRLKL